MADDVTFDVADEPIVPLSVTDPSSEGADFAIGDAIIDAVSPTVDVTAITGGHRMTVHDINGEHTFDVMDGADGADGEDGATGPAGPGVPTGGSTGQVLRKASGTNYDTEWHTPSASDLTTGTLAVANGGTGMGDTVTTSAAADIITAVEGTGCTIVSASFARWGNLASLIFSFKFDAAITVPVSGNIANVTFATLASGKRPAVISMGIITEYLGLLNIGTDGNIAYACFNARGAEYTIAANTTMYARATYLI